MTIQERLQTIGRAIRGTPQPVKEVIKEVEKKVEKSLLGSGYLDTFKLNTLSTETTVSPKTLLANTGWVYVNNDRIAKEVATIEFELFSSRVVGQDIQLVPITSHPILDALDQFNTFTEASSGFYTTQSHKKLTGDCFWYVDGVGPNIKGIYILQPDRMDIEIGKVGRGQVEITEYKYKVNIKGKSQEESYKPEEIIHFKAPNPKNPLRGLGAVEALADDIDLDSLGTEANKQMFKRGLIGSFILTSELSITPEQLKQIRAEFSANYTGVTNAFKVPILSGGLKPESVQMSNKDMEFSNLQTWVRDKICAGFGNPKSIITTDDVNKANAEATILNWKQTTIRSEMKQLTDTLNEFLVPRFGTNLILGFKDPVPEDDSGEVERAKLLFDSKIITKNEARELIDYEPVDGGDEFPAPPTFNPLDDQAVEENLPKSLRHIDFKKYLRRNKSFEKVIEYKKNYDQIKKKTDVVARHIIKARKGKKAHFSSDKVSLYYTKQIKLVEVYEEMFRQKVEKFINKLVDKALAKVPDEVAEMQNKQLFIDEDEIVAATLDFTPLLTEISIAAGTEALNLINSDAPYLANNLRPEIRKRVELFAGSMIDTDKNKLIDMIAEGIQDGLSIPQIRNNIIDDFSDYSKMQAERITRTEVLRASNQAALDAWKESGVVEGKQWLTAPGADEECSVYEGEIVYDLGGSFYSSENEFADGDPPIHPNCRCVVLPVLADSRELSADQSMIISQKNLIKELESKIDKRTKDFKNLKAKNLKSNEYIKELEDYLDEKA